MRCCRGYSFLTQHGDNASRTKVVRQARDRCVSIAAYITAAAAICHPMPSDGYICAPRESLDDLQHCTSHHSIVSTGLCVSSLLDRIPSKEMYRATPRSTLWVVPNGGHGPVLIDAAPQLLQTTLALFREEPRLRFAWRLGSL